MNDMPNPSCKKQLTVQDRLDNLDATIDELLRQRELLEPDPSKSIATRIKPNPDLMPTPFASGPHQPPRTPTIVDPPPSLHALGLNEDKQLQYDLETLQHCLQVLLPKHPFYRGLAYQQVVDKLNFVQEER